MSKAKKRDSLCKNKDAENPPTASSQKHKPELEIKEKRFVEMIMQQQTKAIKSLQKKSEPKRIKPKPVEKEATVDENGFIDHTVDFAQRLSDTNSNSSWDKSCSVASVEEAHSEDPKQKSTPGEDGEGPVFVYNINGEVIDVVHPPEREPTVLSEKAVEEDVPTKSSDGKIVINIACTRYEVVKKAAHK